MQSISREQTDVIKGIAIACVIIAHLGCQLTRLTTPLGGIGVALFLIVSGYGLSLSYEKGKRSGDGLKKYWTKNKNIRHSRCQIPGTKL